MADEATNPVAPGVEQTTQSSAPANDAGPAFEPELGGEGRGEQPPVDDSEEIDYEGGKYKVPKVLKDAFLRNADYTQKTQKLADERRAYEAQVGEFKQFSKLSQDHFEASVKLHGLNTEIASFEKLGREGWARWAQQNPAEAQAAQIEYNALLADRQRLLSDVGAKEAQRRQIEAAEVEKLSAKAETELRAKIKDWGPDKKQGLLKVAADYGFGNGDLAAHDPRVWLALNDLSIYRASLAKATAAATAATTDVKPVPKVGGPAPAAKDPNKMSMDEYARWMNRKERGKEAA